MPCGHSEIFTRVISGVPVLFSGNPASTGSNWKLRFNLPLNHNEAAFSLLRVTTPQISLSIPNGPSQTCHGEGCYFRTMFDPVPFTLMPVQAGHSVGWLEEKRAACAAAAAAVAAEAAARSAGGGGGGGGVGH